jgi:hypothetical protein
MHLFDDGYEKLRERIFENQKKLGVIPRTPSSRPGRTTCSSPGTAQRRREEALHPPGRGLRRLCRLQRPRDRPRDPAFQDLGKLDNTLIIYINGDNGTSAEGGPLGTPNEVAFFNGVSRVAGTCR